uniref:hypothetical protein n=1 Tax=Inquilinus sp. OTU3971 TaxID=3043855 RepID=UPI00313E612F
MRRVRRKPGWTGFAVRRRGDFARFHRGTTRRRAMPNRILIQCLEAAAGRRRRGKPGPRAMRRLTGTAEARLRPGASKGRADRLRLGLDQAYREFRDLDEPPAALPPPGLPPVFEPLLEPSRYKAAFGGRGSGKSH